MFIVRKSTITYYNLILLTLTYFLHTLIILKLDAILKEVHYFQLDDRKDIPQAGLDIYSKREEYREYTVQLEIIIKWSELLC